MLFTLNQTFAQNDSIPTTPDDKPIEISIDSLKNTSDSLQIHTINIHTDSTKRKRNKNNLKPERAALWALIPGGGQLYNKQYWKAPLFAGGTAGLLVGTIKSGVDFRKRRREYIQQLGAIPFDNQNAVHELRMQKDRTRRNFRLFLGSTIVFYGVSVLDAYVNAHIIKQQLNPPHSPAKAAYYSAVLPGLGQIYNKKWWKVPIVYAGLGGIGYAIYYTADRKNLYRDEYLARTRPGYGALNPELAQITDNAQLLTRKNNTRRYMHLSIIVGCLWYVLNIVDANVDAHLIDYDENIKDDLSFEVHPYLQLQDASAPTNGGVRLSLSF